MTTYGQKGGEGPTRGRTAHVYRVVLPDGTAMQKRTFGDYGATALASALRVKGGKILVAIWADRPAWEGDFGYLTATKVR